MKGEGKPQEGHKECCQNYDLGHNQVMSTLIYSLVPRAPSRSPHSFMCLHAHLGKRRLAITK